MMELEGIFRKSGSAQEEQEIIEELGRMREAGVLGPGKSGPRCGYAVAGVIKKFFTRLTEPLIPYATYNKVMGYTSVREEDGMAVIE
jgi:hypothetical protein